MKLHFLTKNSTTIHQIENFVEVLKGEEDYFTSYTSGSTGTPKEIKISKIFAKNSAKATISFLQLPSQGNFLLCLPISSIGGKMMVLRSMELNANLYIGEVTSSPFKNIPTGLGLDFVAMTPMQLDNVIDSQRTYLKSVRKIIIGGGTISAALEQKLSKSQVTVYQTYGMTETISHVAMRKVGYETEEYYTALPNITFSKEGERLVIHAPHLGCNSLITNDIIELVNSTSFKWLGRSDFAINSGGIKIHPEVIEAKLAFIIETNFFLFGIPDDVLGERLILAIEGEDKGLHKDQLLKLLDKYFVPKEIWTLPKFSYTHSSKINRKETIQKLHATGVKTIL